MKICYINPTNNIRRPIAELARLMAEKGHNISIIYPSSLKCKTKGFHFIKLLKHKNIKLTPIRSYYYYRLRYSLPNPFELFLKIKKAIEENDIIHVWEYYYPISVLPILLKLFNKKIKLILTTDGFVGYSYKPKGLTLLFRVYTFIFARLLFKIPNVITTYGKSMLPYAKKAHVPIRKLKIIPTGIDIDKFKKGKKGKIRKEFGIGKSFLILFVGMLTERKNVDIVIKVSRKLLDAGFDIITLIVGEGPLERKFKKMVPYKYKNKIIFTGGREDIINFYKDADVLFLPSIGEGLPGVVMEAMACGLPSVATDEGCTPDLITNGKEGFLVKAWDKKGYFDALVRLIKDKKTILKISRASISKVKLFNWREVFKEYEKLYEFLK